MFSEVIVDSHENSIIVACSVGMGVGVTVVPELFAKLPSSLQILTSNGVVAGTVRSIVLNLIFNMTPTRRKVTVLKGKQAS